MDSYADQLMDNIVCKGKGAGYGVVRGKAVFSFNDALQEIDNQITPVLFMEGGKLAKAALKVTNSTTPQTRVNLPADHANGGDYWRGGE